MSSYINIIVSLVTFRLCVALPLLSYRLPKCRCATKTKLWPEVNKTLGRPTRSYKRREGKNTEHRSTTRQAVSVYQHRPETSEKLHRTTHCLHATNECTQRENLGKQTQSSRETDHTRHCCPAGRPPSLENV